MALDSVSLLAFWCWRSFMKREGVEYLQGVLEASISALELGRFLWMRHYLHQELTGYSPVVYPPSGWSRLTASDRGSEGPRDSWGGDSNASRKGDSGAPDKHGGNVMWRERWVGAENRGEGDIQKRSRNEDRRRSFFRYREGITGKGPDVNEAIFRLHSNYKLCKSHIHTHSSAKKRPVI